MIDVRTHIDGIDHEAHLSATILRHIESVAESFPDAAVGEMSGRVWPSVGLVEMSSRSGGIVDDTDVLPEPLELLVAGPDLNMAEFYAEV